MASCDDIGSISGEKHQSERGREFKTTLPCCRGVREEVEVTPAVACRASTDGGDGAPG
jgi:hypothetical protein